MTFEEVERFLDEKHPPIVDNVTPPSSSPFPAPNEDFVMDNVIRPPGWKPMTTAEAEKILAEEEPWPDDPDC